MRLWVTGAAGFVARHLVPYLESRGHEVRGLGLQTEPPSWLRPGAYRTLDLVSSQGVEAAARESQPEAVLHLAGQSSAAASFRSPELTFNQNLGSALGLLEGLRRAAVRPRVILVSTSEVYGPQATAAPVSEDAPLNLVSPYGASKLAAETIGESYGRLFGIPVVRVRPFSHTGLGQDDRFALSSFARQIAEQEMAGGPGTLKVGNLDAVRDYMDVADVARAYEVLMLRGEPGQVYNIASGTGHRIGDLLEKLLSFSRVPLRPETDPSRLRTQDFNYMVGDSARIRAIGWQPQSGVERALEALLEGWRTQCQRSA